jgi:hypothetical protein
MVSLPAYADALMAPLYLEVPVEVLGYGGSKLAGGGAGIQTIRQA